MARDEPIIHKRYNSVTSSPSSTLTRWLITGGCGFIGANLVRKLVSEGCHVVRVLDNLSGGNRDDLAQVCRFMERHSSDLSSDAGVPPVKHTLSQKSVSPPAPNVELIVGDIRDVSLVMGAVKGIDVVVHLAASTGVGPSIEDPQKDMETNVIGLFNVLEASRRERIRRFIFASSGASIGEAVPPIHEELAPHPLSPYGASKLAGEAYCSAYYRSFGLETVSLRFGNVYGPGSRHKKSLVAKFIHQAMEGKTCQIYGDGTQTRDFIYIDDLVAAILKASAASVGGEIFQIATSKEHRVNDVAERLEILLRHHGLDMEIEHDPPRPGDVKRSFSDTSKAQKMLKWKAQVSLSRGLSRTVEWFLTIGA
jgi:UDP-glucose 4-epimerase